jgi:two-component system response regulator GlrR
VIQQREIRKVGSSATLPIDVRIVAASISDLGEMVREKTFREDLYFRLNVVAIRLPPLRERKDDIPRLAFHFLKKLAAENKKDISDFSPKAMRKLMTYDWPGNVRELENKIEQAVVMCMGKRIDAEDLYIPFDGGEDKEYQDFKQTKRNVVDAFEKKYISEKLHLTSGNVTEASKLAGMERSGFQKIMRKHKIRSLGFRK